MAKLHTPLTEDSNPLSRKSFTQRNASAERPPSRAGTVHDAAAAHADARALRECRSARRRLWRPRIALASALGALLALGALAGCSQEARDLVIPTLYVTAGRVIDPTTNPIAGLAGARVTVDGTPQVVGTTSDADGNFVLQGVPRGVHRLRAQLPGRVITVTYDFLVEKNVIDALVPLFTSSQIDSILTARGAPAWNRAFGLFGLFALKSTGVPLGDALVNIAPSPGGTLVQTGQGKDPIVVVNGTPGDFSLSIARGGYVWDAPYGLSLRPGVLTFAAPRARPNFGGYAFANQPSASPVTGAAVTLVSGPGAGSTVTSFLGQFIIVGLVPGTYAARITSPAFLPELTWPQHMIQDTTLIQVMVEPDTLVAWSVGDGGPTPTMGRGHMVVEARAAVGGQLALGANIAIEAGHGGGFDTAIPQAAGHPALRLDLDPGYYRVWVTAPGFADSSPIDSVDVRIGEITYARIELETPAGALRSIARRRYLR